MHNDEERWFFEPDDPDNGYRGYVLHTCDSGEENNAYPGDQTLRSDEDDVVVLRTIVCDGCEEIYYYNERYPAAHFTY